MDIILIWLFCIFLIGFVIWIIRPPFLSNKLRKKAKQDSLGSKENKATNQAENYMANAIEQVVADYMTFMQSDMFPIMPTIADTNRLPYSKDVLKAALILSLIERPDEKSKKDIIMGYCCLANFQVGVGDVFLGYDYAHLMKEYNESVSVTPEMREFLTTTAKSLIEFDKERYETFNKLVVPERIELLEALNSLSEIASNKNPEQFRKYLYSLYTPMASIMAEKLDNAIQTFNNSDAILLSAKANTNKCD